MFTYLLISIWLTLYTNIESDQRPLVTDDGGLEDKLIILIYLKNSNQRSITLECKKIQDFKIKEKWNVDVLLWL